MQNRRDTPTKSDQEHAIESRWFLQVQYTHPRNANVAIGGSTSAIAPKPFQAMTKLAAVEHRTMQVSMIAMVRNRSSTRKRE